MESFSHFPTDLRSLYPKPGNIAMVFFVMCIPTKACILCRLSARQFSVVCGFLFSVREQNSKMYVCREVLSAHRAQAANNRRQILYKSICRFFCFYAINRNCRQTPSRSKFLFDSANTEDYNVGHSKIACFSDRI